MDTGLSPHAVVRVKLLLQTPEQYDAWQLNQRSPALGDIGTIVHVLHARGQPDKFVVECVRADGSIEWLADFFEEEIELDTDVL